MPLPPVGPDLGKVIIQIGFDASQYRAAVAGSQAVAREATRKFANSSVQREVVKRTAVKSTQKSVLKSLIKPTPAKILSLSLTGFFILVDVLPALTTYKITKEVVELGEKQDLPVLEYTSHQLALESKNLIHLPADVNVETTIHAMLIYYYNWAKGLGDPITIVLEEDNYTVSGYIINNFYFHFEQTWTSWRGLLNIATGREGKKITLTDLFYFGINLGPFEDIVPQQLPGSRDSNTKIREPEKGTKIIEPITDVTPMVAPPYEDIVPQIEPEKKEKYWLIDNDKDEMEKLADKISRLLMGAANSSENESERQSQQEEPLAENFATLLKATADDLNFLALVKALQARNRQEILKVLHDIANIRELDLLSDSDLEKLRDSIIRNYFLIINRRPSSNPIHTVRKLVNDNLKVMLFQNYSIQQPDDFSLDMVTEVYIRFNLQFLIELFGLYLPGTEEIDAILEKYDGGEVTGADDHHRIVELVEPRVRIFVETHNRLLETEIWDNVLTFLLTRDMNIALSIREQFVDIYHQVIKDLEQDPESIAHEVTQEVKLKNLEDIFEKHYLVIRKFIQEYNLDPDNTIIQISDSDADLDFWQQELDFLHRMLAEIQQSEIALDFEEVINGGELEPARRMTFRSNFIEIFKRLGQNKEQKLLGLLERVSSKEETELSAEELEELLPEDVLERFFKLIEKDDTIDVYEFLGECVITTLKHCQNDKTIIPKVISGGIMIPPFEVIKSQFSTPVQSFLEHCENKGIPYDLWLHPASAGKTDIGYESEEVAITLTFARDSSKTTFFMFTRSSTRNEIPRRIIRKYLGKPKVKDLLRARNQAAENLSGIMQPGSISPLPFNNEADEVFIDRDSYGEKFYGKVNFDTGLENFSFNIIFSDVVDVLKEMFPDRIHLVFLFE